MLRVDLGQALREALAPEREFWSSRRTVEELSKGGYFLDEGASEATWPDLFSAMLGMICCRLAMVSRTAIITFFYSVSFDWG